MKHYTRALSLLLAIVMVLSCVGTTMAAERKTTVQQVASTGRPAGAEKSSAGTGFKSPAFISQNAYQYAEDLRTGLSTPLVFH